MKASAVSPEGLPAVCALPRARQTARWMSRPAQFLQSLQEQHGDVFTLQLLQEPPWVLVSDPRLVKQIYTAPADALHAGVSKRIFESVLGRESVLLADGEQHMRWRRLLLSPFQADRIGRHEQTMRAVAATALDAWPFGEPVPALPRMSELALEVILRAVFGVAEEDRRQALRKALERLMAELSAGTRAVVALGESGRLEQERFATLRTCIAAVEELALAEIAASRSASGLRDRDDVLAQLVGASDLGSSPASDRELCRQLLTLVIAGHDTSATSLAWALERLARNPEALRRTEAEAAAGGGPYTDAVVKETLRARPVFPVTPRLARRPFRLGGMTIPEGVAVTPAIPLVHRRPDIYPDPEAFRPERFLERQPDTYAWIPFGGGVRRCIGAGFALLEMRVTLSTLLSRATIHAVDERPEREKRRGLVNSPADGALLVLEPR